MDLRRFGRHQVTQRIGRIVPANAVVIGIDFEDVFGAVGVVLEGGEAIEEAGAATVDEEGGFDGGIRIAQASEDFRPAVEAVGVGRTQGDAQVGVLPGDGDASALPGEEIGAGDEAAERGAWSVFGGAAVDGGEGGGFRRGVEVDSVAVEHGFDGLGVALGDPAAGGVLVHDKKVAVVVVTTEQGDGVVVEPVVKGGEPLGGAAVVEVVHDVDVAAEGGEELAGGDVPVAVAPGAFLPAGEVVEDVAVFGIGEGVVGEGGGNEPGGGFAALLIGDEVTGAIPGVADTAGVGGGIDARAPGDGRVEG